MSNAPILHIFIGVHVFVDAPQNNVPQLSISLIFFFIGCNGVEVGAEMEGFNSEGEKIGDEGVTVKVVINHLLLLLLPLSKVGASFLGSPCIWLVFSYSPFSFVILLCTVERDLLLF